MIKPKTWVFPPARMRADELGMKFSSLIAARTFAAVSSDTGKLLFKTRLTVAIDTPACFDTSLMVMRLIVEGLAILFTHVRRNVSAYESAYMIIDVL